MTKQLFQLVESHMCVIVNVTNLQQSCSHATAREGQGEDAVNLWMVGVREGELSVVIMSSNSTSKNSVFLLHVPIASSSSSSSCSGS